MTDLEQPLFRSVEHALAFAFRHEHGAISRPLMNRMADGPRRIGRGLVGLDAAGQAGLILSAVRELGEFAEALGMARYGERDRTCICGNPCCSGRVKTREWKRAIAVCTEYALRASTIRSASSFQLRLAIVAKHFGEKRNLREIAQRCRVHPDTASAEAKEIIAMFKTEESRLRAHVYERFFAELEDA